MSCQRTQHNDPARARHPTRKLGRREQVGGGSRGGGLTLILSVGEGGGGLKLIFS